jgi:pyruvate-formate lyase-activating enzyme
VSWGACRFASCSVLPVARACGLRCRFCFSRSSISAEARASALRGLDVGAYYRFARSRGASRLVITGGGEPLLDPEGVLRLVSEGRRYFQEITCFTNGARLTPELARALEGAGLSYLCWSRHHWDDARNRALMGAGAPSLEGFFAAAGGLTVRATCVMARGYVEDRRGAGAYMAALRGFGVRQFTFKHTYVAYTGSLYQGSEADRWSAENQVESDPFEGEGRPLGRLPWGPTIRAIEGCQVCFYREPTPAWELENRLCRSANLMADGRVYASLEDRRSLLYQLSACSTRPAPSA